MRWAALDVRLLVDGEEIDLNEFVKKILSGTVVGAVTSLRGVKKEWKKIEIEMAKQKMRSDGHVSSAGS